MAAIVSARAGDRERARAELARALLSVAGDSGLRTDLLLEEAPLWYALGVRDSATNRLERYIAARGYREYIETDPLLSPIMTAIAAAAKPGSPRH